MCVCVFDVTGPEAGLIWKGMLREVSLRRSGGEEFEGSDTPPATS